MIAVTFALPAESSGLVRRLAHKSAISGMSSGVSGMLAAQEVHIIHTGVGEPVARVRLSDYMQSHSPSYLISSGFAGGTREEYAVGDFILARNFSDATLLGTAAKVLCNQNVRSAVSWTVASILNSPQEREQIWNEHNAIAVDMESKAIAEVCASRGVRMLSLRVLSDTSCDPLRIPGNILFDVQRQRTPMLRLFGYLARHPASVAELIRFSGQIARVRRGLTDAIVKVIEAI
jgi:nucleoside phosphorylase